MGQAIERLYRSGAVEYAEPNALIIPQANPDDPLFVNQWNLFNDGGAGTEGADIKALDAWGITVGGNNAIVAVIDSGVDYYHEDLAANMWINAGETAGNITDDDFNHFVDDYFGINTATPVGYQVLAIPWTSRPWYRHGRDHRRRGQQQQRHGRRQLASPDHGPQVHDHHRRRRKRHHMHQLCLASGPRRLPRLPWF